MIRSSAWLKGLFICYQWRQRSLTEASAVGHGSWRSIYFHGGRKRLVKFDKGRLPGMGSCQNWVFKLSHKLPSPRYQSRISGATLGQLLPHCRHHAQYVWRTVPLKYPGQTCWWHHLKSRVHPPTNGTCFVSEFFIHLTSIRFGFVQQHFRALLSWVFPWSGYGSNILVGYAPNGNQTKAGNFSFVIFDKWGMDEFLIPSNAQKDVLSFQGELHSLVLPLHFGHHSPLLRTVIEHCCETSLIAGAYHCQPPTTSNHHEPLSPGWTER